MLPRALTTRIRSTVTGSAPTTPATVSTWLLVALLGGAGVAHFVKPDTYIGYVPDSIPGAPTVVAVSGVAEIACAGLLVVPATRRWGGWASAALLIGVFPANISMAVKAFSQSWPRKAKVITLARLPLQGPPVWWALRAAGVGRRR